MTARELWYVAPMRPALSLALALALAACSGGDDTSPSSPGTSSGSSGATSSSGGGSATVNGCTAFEDQTAATAARKIVWDTSVASKANRCMKVKVGQTVAYEGNFATHPLGAAGGDSPSPFASVPDTGKVTFDRAGTFGYVCRVHPSMTGAVLVE